MALTLREQPEREYVERNNDRPAVPGSGAAPDWARENMMGKDAQGVRNGTGPYKDSYQNQQTPGTGRRQALGKACPVKDPPPAPATAAPTQTPVEK